MARLTVERLTKSFGTTRVLDDVTLAVNDGELVAILGPSGCGKTTLLRQVAGFDKPDAGRILIGEAEVSGPGGHLPPERRRIGIVFQSYALWPHMSVAGNVAYGLAVAGVREPERTRRVKAALALVGLEGFDDRPPAMLSGGQRQRVALARCLVTEPSLVLLDEPLANLDVHLRATMEREFARFHERTGTTMLYITHDQAEAMALANRIAVMDRGRVLQFATPSELYRSPCDETVARFVGEGMVVPVEVREAAAGACAATLYGTTLRLRCAPTQRAGAAKACLRAESLRVTTDPARGFPALVRTVTYEGGRFRVEAEVQGAGEMLHFHAIEPCALAPGASIRLEADDGWVIAARDG
ncbi:MAG: ABC transporter ATP-binding protein [Burkholderiales bacterium]|nr:ABC transporter ATP-binding protein [Burkholderiales bacterium]MCE7876442.1 ABC transporter ATP-binding protein [Betaproteobacteria bacterium PRO3]